MKQEMLWKLRVVRLVWLRRCTGALLFQTDGCAFVSLWASGAYRDRRTLEMCLILQLIIKSCSYTNKPRCFFIKSTRFHALPNKQIMQNACFCCKNIGTGLSANRLLIRMCLFDIPNTRSD